MILPEELNEYNKMLQIAMKILRNDLEEDDKKIENIECKMHKDIYKDEEEDDVINHHLKCIAIVRSEYVPEEPIVDKKYFDKPCSDCIPKYRARIVWSKIDNERMKIEIDIEDGYDPEEYYDDEAERRQIEWLKENGYWY